jgi:hypothetical protein
MALKSILQGCKTSFCVRFKLSRSDLIGVILFKKQMFTALVTIRALQKQHLILGNHKTTTSRQVSPDGISQARLPYCEPDIV